MLTDTIISKIISFLDHNNLYIKIIVFSKHKINPLKLIVKDIENNDNYIYILNKLINLIINISYKYILLISSINHCIYYKIDELNKNIPFIQLYINDSKNRPKQVFLNIIGYDLIVGFWNKIDNVFDFRIRKQHLLYRFKASTHYSLSFLTKEDTVLPEDINDIIKIFIQKIIYYINNYNIIFFNEHVDALANIKLTIQYPKEQFTYSPPVSKSFIKMYK